MHSRVAIHANIVLCNMVLCCCCFYCCIAEKRFTAVNKTLLVVTEALSQTDAKARCKARGGELITADLLAERRVAVAEFSGMNLDDPDGSLFTIWIGLEAKGRTPSNRANDYLWLTTGRTARVDTQAWNTGEPNNDGGVEGVCVAQYNWNDGIWNDRSCGDYLPTLCQIGKWLPG